MTLKAIIFDMDGVLIHSFENVKNSLTETINEDTGIILTKEDYKDTLGRSLKDMLQIWKKKYPQMPNYVPEELSKKSGKKEIEILKQQIDNQPNIQKLLEEARRQRIKTAVATSRMLRAILENYQEKNGKIKIPKVLHKYVDFKEI